MPTTARSSTRNSTLSRDKIIKAAYQLAKKDPVNALSMRKIATKLKVTPMAIYKYFSDKNELTAAVIDLHLEKSNLIPTEVDPADWRTWIKSSFYSMWDAYDTAPGMLQYMINATSFGPAVLNWQNEALKVLINAGLTPKQALTAHAAMAELTTGSTILVPVRKLGVQNIFPGIWKDLSEGRVPNLDNSEEIESMGDYPWVLMCGQAMMEDMQDTRNAFGNEIDLLLDSIAAQIEKNKAAE